MCKHLRAHVHPEVTVNDVVSKLTPILQSLYPHATGVPWHDFLPIIKGLVETLGRIRVERDIYVPFFPERGTSKTDFEVARGNQEGIVSLCTFPGLTRRFWNDRDQGWYEILMMPAIVELDGRNVRR